MGDLLPQLVANHLFAHDQSAHGIPDRLIQFVEVSMLNTHIVVTPVLGDPIQGHFHAAVLLCIVHVVITSYMNNIYPENIMPLQWTNENEEVSLPHIY